MARSKNHALDIHDPITILYKNYYHYYDEVLGSASISSYSPTHLFFSEKSSTHLNLAAKKKKNNIK